MLGNGLVHKPF